MVFAHILELARRLGHHDRTAKDGRWTQSEDFCYWDYAQLELTGRILGLIGCGNIGRKVAAIARGFGLKVIAYDVYPSAPEELQIEFVDLETIFRESDVISLHCPLTPETEGIVNSSSLATMKPTAFLINTSRGPLVKDDELAEALNTGVIAGAGLDVLSVEPPPADNPLFAAKNCHLSPHLAWASREARERLIRLTAENLKAWMDGEPINVVN
jgi:glycerate dehydrogenase